MKAKILTCCIVICLILPMTVSVRAAPQIADDEYRLVENQDVAVVMHGEEVTLLCDNPGLDTADGEGMYWLDDGRSVELSLCTNDLTSRVREHINAKDLLVMYKTGVSRAGADYLVWIPGEYVIKRQPGAGVEHYTTNEIDYPKGNEGYSELITYVFADDSELPYIKRLEIFHHYQTDQIELPQDDEQYQLAVLKYDDGSEEYAWVSHEQLGPAEEDLPPEPTPTPTPLPTETPMVVVTPAPVVKPVQKISINEILTLSGVVFSIVGTALVALLILLVVRFKEAFRIKSSELDAKLAVLDTQLKEVSKATKTAAKQPETPPSEFADKQNARLNEIAMKLGQLSEIAGKIEGIERSLIVEPNTEVSFEAWDCSQLIAEYNELVGKGADRNEFLVKLKDYSPLPLHHVSAYTGARTEICTDAYDIADAKLFAVEYKGKMLVVPANDASAEVFRDDGNALVISWYETIRAADATRIELSYPAIAEKDGGILRLISKGKVNAC